MQVILEVNDAGLEPRAGVLERAVVAKVERALLHGRRVVEPAQPASQHRHEGRRVGQQRRSDGIHARECLQTNHATSVSLPLSTTSGTGRKGRAQRVRATSSATLG